MLAEGTIIKSTFKNNGENEYFFGKIVSYQEGNGAFAEGYLVHFDDDNMTIFLNKRVVNELYEVVDDVESTLKDKNKIGQLSMEDYL